MPPLGDQLELSSSNSSSSSDGGDEDGSFNADSSDSVDKQQQGPPDEQQFGSVQLQQGQAWSLPRRALPDVRMAKAVRLPSKTIKSAQVA
eukprot:SAG11_NODE_26004_length_351_cov_0.611111_1_plen_89_part_10